MFELFALRHKLSSSLHTALVISGFVIALVIWWILAEVFSKKRPVLSEYHTVLPSSIDSLLAVDRDSILRLDSIAFANATEFEKVYPLLPRPDRVFLSFKDLWTTDRLLSNTAHSVWLNVQGYFWAIVISLPLGLILGLIPLFRSLFNKQVDALRFLPLSALTGLFIIWFGLGDPMKIAFLAVGIIVYLVPVVIQRMDEVEDTLVQTSFTLGASKWQQIKHVFLPASITRLSDDIRVLTAISWTYIIIAELLNKESGIGALIYTKARQGQIDRVFALLIIIILIGLVQDKLMALMDRMINPHKYYKVQLDGLAEGRIGVYAVFASILCGVLCHYFLKVPFLCTMAWLLAASGSVILFYGYFKMEKAVQK